MKTSSKLHNLLHTKELAMSVRNALRGLAVSGLMIAAISTNVGCDEMAGGAGYGGGYGGYDHGGGYGAIDSGVAENAAGAWDQYITGDYNGSASNDPNTPDMWASGPEWSPKNGAKHRK
jgi:hypothetical protein